MANRRKGTLVKVKSGLGAPATLAPGTPTPIASGLAPGMAAPQGPIVQAKRVLPPDPLLEAARATAGRNVALSDADAGYQNANIENVYGLGSDTSNPYSKAKLLAENWRRSQRGTMNSYAAMGQYNSGAYQRMQGENDRGYSMGYDQLARGYQADKYAVRHGQAATYASNSLGVDSEAFESVLRALRSGG